VGNNYPNVHEEKLSCERSVIGLTLMAALLKQPGQKEEAAHTSK